MPTHGYLMVQANPAPDHEDEFNAWYDTEHLAERVAVPGFLSGLRFVAAEGHPKYLAFYDMTALSVLDSDEYLAVSGANFSPWTRRVTTRTKVDRSVGHQLWPGDAVLQASPRLRLLRFDMTAPAALIDTVQTIAADPASGVRQAMVLQSDPAGRLYVLMNASFCEPEHIFLPRLGALAAQVVQHNTYTAYRPY